MSLWKYNISFKITQTLTENLKKYFEVGVGSVYVGLQGVKLMEVKILRTPPACQKLSPLPQQEYEWEKSNQTKDNITLCTKSLN